MANCSRLSPRGSWFEFRVQYLKVNSYPCLILPEFLSLKYTPRRCTTILEVNGGRVPPSEEAVVLLRRDRLGEDDQLDKGIKEITYVNTEHLRVNGTVFFEISDESKLLLLGSLSHSNTCTEYYDEWKSPGAISQLGWNMNCTCVIESPGCVFFNAKHDFPTMDVCLAGYYGGRPVILEQTVILNLRKRGLGRKFSDLSIILEEEDEVAKAAADEPSKDEPFVSPPTKEPSLLMNSDGGHKDEGLSWFKAGIGIGFAVGVGVSMGLCFGGQLIIRTYQSTNTVIMKCYGRSPLRT